MDDLRLDNEEPEEPGKKVWGLAVGILAVLAVIAALYYFLFVRKPAPPAPAEPAPAAALPVEGAGAPAAGGIEPLAFPAVPLAGSDPAVREFAAALSADPEFAKWLLSADLLRTFVVAVDNVANGLSPKPHIGFFSPAGEFRVARTKAGTIVDPAAYGRYDAVTRVALSLDPTAAARLYRAVDPLVQEAYNELGYPGVDFDDTLVRAMAELLETPVVEGPIGLERKVLSWAMTDPVLEALSPAQKQLLRLGPRGVRAVHDKILALAAALGVAPARLPRPKAYAGAGR